ncbi:MAG: histidine kinase [Lachnospiraceae bacterium]|jgi:Predicted signal transduction protein with a C-terminal ATPase domain|nr:histidine kinase [Lachnospiraceae bacterium]
MEFLKRKFRNIKIRSKVIYSCVLIAFIPFCLIGSLGVSISTREMEKNVTQYTMQMVEQILQTVDIYLNSIEKKANMLIRMVEPLHVERIKDSEDPSWEMRQEVLCASFQTVAETHEEIAGIFFATENDLYVSTRMSRTSRDSFTKESWYQKAKERPEEMQIISDVTGRNIATDKTYSIDDVFSIVKAVRNPDTGEVAGVLLLDIKHDIISSAIRDVIIGENGFVYVLDSTGHIVYTPANAVVYRIKPEWLQNGREQLRAEIQGQTYQITYQQSEYSGWKIVSVSSYREIMGNVNKMFFTFVALLVVTVLIVMYVAVKISETITKPIVKLRNLMKQTEEGELTVRFTGDYQDEISDLGRTFNHMLERIQELLEQVYMEQENKRQAELKVVQEQFKPHFLYNTLDTIGWMAREHSADDIVHVVDALTNVFRISLSKGKDYITLQDEIRYITNYLYIQKIRYGPKVCYEVTLEPGCEAQEVPKLILQPLVENAIYHGVKLKRGEGHLSVRVAKEGEKNIRLQVKDDGRGMGKERAEDLEKLLNEPSKPEQNRSFGLFYVKERLRIRYGDNYQVKVHSIENEGTTVVIFIPVKEQ